jgi:ribose 5-phosphate isomerase A
MDIVASEIDRMKRAAAKAALAYVEPGAVLGVGTGSTVGFFIDALTALPERPSAVVATSQRTAQRLAEIGLEVVELEDAGPVTVYVDGADEIDPEGRTMKGGGGAQAAEKRVATRSRAFVCIVDQTKLVDRLGSRSAVPLEIVEAYAESVFDAVRALGGHPELRPGPRSDDGNILADAFELDLSDPEAIEDALEAIPGVVACGVFAHRRADVVIVGTLGGQARVTRPA